MSMHYFDSRGVFRLYEVSIDNEALRIWRDASGFSQRFTGTFADGGDTIAGTWLPATAELAAPAPTGRQARLASDFEW